ncbi:nitronate monooxygenase, partial [Streptomyces smaragdinus]|uniref:nitronate monooxygenase n=1 Tax=Streptomyces smaragdinus TaxID=2585196 RepID=UPI00225E52F9
MGGSAGGELARAVSEAGGLGMVGVGGGDAGLVERELPLVAGCGRPWGVGFLTWGIEEGAVARVLSYGPTAVMFSFGDPSPYVAEVRDAGALVFMQVTGMEEARQAVELGADVIVAQGTEGGAVDLA